MISVLGVRITNLNPAWDIEEKHVSETLPIEAGHFVISPIQGGLSSATIIDHIVKI